MPGVFSPRFSCTCQTNLEVFLTAGQYVFANGQDMRQEDSSRWNLSGLGDCPLCMESLMNLSLVVSIVSEGGL